MNFAKLLIIFLSSDTTQICLLLRFKFLLCNWFLKVLSKVDVLNRLKIHHFEEWHLKYNLKILCKIIFNISVGSKLFLSFNSDFKKYMSLLLSYNLRRKLDNNPVSTSVCNFSLKIMKILFTRSCQYLLGMSYMDMVYLWNHLSW